MKTNCGARPRCGTTVPNVKRLLDAARAHDMMVFYTLVGGTPTPEGMVDPSLAPRVGEWVVRGGADKFISSDLEQRLKDINYGLIATRQRAWREVIGLARAVRLCCYDVKSSARVVNLQPLEGAFALSFVSPLTEFPPWTFWPRVLAGPFLQSFWRFKLFPAAGRMRDSMRKTPPIPKKDHNIVK
jgi:hypothetical protein